VTTLAMGSSEFSTVWFNKDGSASSLCQPFG
jgi:hypothetical protein